MTDRPSAFLVGDDGQIGVAVDLEAGIHQLAVHAARQRGAREAGADGGGHFMDRYRFVERTDRAVRQANVWHINSNEGEYFV